MSTDNEAHGGGPAGSPEAQGGAAAPDPSMEDILASIRRILNEEDAPAAPTEPAPAAGPFETAGGDQVTPTPDVLELDHTMMLPDPEPVAEPPPVQRAAPAAIEPVMVVPPPAGPPPGSPPLAAPPMAAPSLAATPPAAPAPVAPQVAEPLVAPAAAAAAAMSVGALMRTLATERSTQVHRGGPTIEDLVREEIRPLLKEWLDSQLAPMVERLVRTEIERVVNRMT